MKNIREMTDVELMNQQYDCSEIMLRADNPFNPAANVSIEQRETALNTLREIRLEGWRRGWNGTPTEERRADYERHIARNAKRLEDAKKNGNVLTIFAKMDMLRASQDRLDWINGDID